MRFTVIAASTAIMVGTLCQPCGLCRGEQLLSVLCSFSNTEPIMKGVRFEMRFTVIALPPPSCWVPRGEYLRLVPR